MCEINFPIISELSCIDAKNWFYFKNGYFRYLFQSLYIVLSRFFTASKMVILVLFSRCWSFRTFERCSRSKIMKIMKCALFIFYAFSLVFQFFIANKSYHSILLPTFSARKVDWDKGKKIEFSRKNNKNAWLQVNDRFFGYGDFSVFMHFFFPV